MASIGPVVSEEKLFENVDNTHIHTYIHTHVRTTEAYKLTSEHKGSGELKYISEKIYEKEFE